MQKGTRLPKRPKQIRNPESPALEMRRVWRSQALGDWIWTTLPVSFLSTIRRPISLLPSQASRTCSSEHKGLKQNSKDKVPKEKENKMPRVPQQLLGGKSVSGQRTGEIPTLTPPSDFLFNRLLAAVKTKRQVMSRHHIRSSTRQPDLRETAALTRGQEPPQLPRRGRCSSSSAGRASRGFQSHGTLEPSLPWMRAQ